MARRIAAIFAFAVVLSSAAGASAYEFHLLNGMVLKGRLTLFKDGTFHVETEFGSVTLDADKLDYIIVEETDEGPAKKAAPGLGLGGPSEPEPVAPTSQKPAPPAPAPLSGRTIEAAPEGVLSPGFFRRRP